MRRLGVLGGSFNPVHTGHLLQGQEVSWRLKLDGMLFIPAGSPPHKTGRHLFPFEDRLAMLRLATAGNPPFEVLDLEGRRDGPSYTLDTLLELSKLYPGDALYFILGLDAFLEILTWYKYAELARHCHFVVNGRPGHGIVNEDLGPIREIADGLQARLHLGEEPPETPNGCVLLVDFPGLEVSSTFLRERIASDSPIRYYVPDTVARYIEQHRRRWFGQLKTAEQNPPHS